MRRAVPGWVLLVLLSSGVEGVHAGDADTLERISSHVAVDASGAVHDLSDQRLSRGKIKHWKPIIDATWGPGAPTSEKLSVFDAAWEDLDTGYGAFVNLDVDLAKLRDKYRHEIEAGVSRGRFVAIMNHLARAMKDLHTVIFNRDVNQTPITAGVPLMIVRGWPAQQP